MARYADGTSVSPEKSRSEIEKLLSRFGADRFAYGWAEDAAMIGFQFKGKMIRMKLPLPKTTDPQVCKTDSGRMRAKGDLARSLEAETRRRWRSLALAVKAKLEAVDSGIATFENEWLAYTVTPNGQTVGEIVVPQLEEAVNTGKMPMLQLGMGSGR